MRTNIVIDKEGLKIAVGIETGKSDWKANLRKNITRGFSQIIMIGTNSDAYSKLQKEIPKEWLKIVTIDSVQNYFLKRRIMFNEKIISKVISLLLTQSSFCAKK